MDVDDPVLDDLVYPDADDLVSDDPVVDGQACQDDLDDPVSDDRASVLVLESALVLAVPVVELA